MYRQLSAPVSCQIEVTTACNLNCIHCYNYWRHGRHPGEVMMSEQLLDAITKEIIRNKVFHTTFTGGEPFANRKVLFRGIECLCDAGVICDVNTNLTLMTPSDAKRLLHAGVGGVLSSFASGREALHDEIMQRRGAFVASVRGINTALDSGLTVAASMVVTKLNLDSIVETGLFLKGLGVKQFYVTKASPPINSVGFGKYLLTQEELVRLLEAAVLLRDVHGMEIGALECYPLCSYLNQHKYSFMSDRRCSAGITTCSISSGGEVRACSHDNVVYGDLRTGELSDAWSKMSEWRSGALLPQECKQCELFSHCSGGCRVDAEWAHGKKCSLDPYAVPQRLNEVVLHNSENTATGPCVEQVFTVVEPLYSRNEDFCVLCADRSRIASPRTLSFDTFELLEHLQGTDFTAKDVAGYTELDVPSAMQLCAALYADGLLTFAPRKGGER